MHTLYTRINTGLLVFIALTGVVLVTMLATRAYGGPLDPPGAPAPTMKTLQQVEPRTPISQPASAAGFPIQINAPGSYYLTENITGVTANNGIEINVDNVTLDLNGFTLSGGGDQNSVEGIYGIDTDNGSSRTNLIIRNGIVRGWHTGVHTPNSTRSTYEDLTVTDSGNTGMRIGSGSNARRLTVWNTSGWGLVIPQVFGGWGTIVEDSKFGRSAGGILIEANNVWVHHNIIDANVADGINVISTVAYNEITENNITGNGGFGVELLGGYSVVVRNVIYANTTGQLHDTGPGNWLGPFWPPSTDPNANIGYP
jgi:hypothetical protein